MTVTAPPSIVRIHLILQENRGRDFFPLFQKGVRLRTKIGGTIREMLCGEWGLDPAYVENRIQTIFQDGKAVDDLDRALLQDGSVLALSAAMPGLAGAILRRKGYLGALRSPIAPRGWDSSRPPGEGKVTLKIFNLLLEELVPLLLARGVEVQWEDWRDWVQNLSPEFWARVQEANLNGEKVKPEEIRTLCFERPPKGIDLRVTSQTESDLHAS